MKKRFFGEEKRRYQSVGTWVRKGSATMEYIILIAVGALFAGLLYLAMSDGEGLIQSAMEKKVQEIIQGQLPEEKPSENNLENSGSSGIGNAPEMGDPRDIGGNPEIGASPDAGIPPELEGPSAGSGTTPADGNPEADGTSPSTTGGGSGSADGNASASSSPSESEEKGGLSGWWEKTKNYVASGQILKDAAHLGKETLDFLILDDVSGCITGKDTDGNELAGWERGLSCVSLVPVAKWVKFGKYADEALTFAGKLDDKLAKTRLGEGLQTAKRKLTDRFSKGKETACGCPDNVGNKVEKGSRTIEKIVEVHSYERARNMALDMLGDLGPTARPVYGRLFQSKGKIIGRQSADKKKSWRLDWDPEKGPHINVEDYSRGRAKSGKGVKVAIKFPGDYDYYLALLRRLNK